MSRTNIVWLTNDHVLYAHHRALTGRPVMTTFDGLCQRGVCFSNAFSVSPVCTPARASLLTGVYPHRHGMYQNDGLGGSRLDFDPSEKLISHYLDQAGYRIGYFGKWHVGEARTAQDYGFEGFSCEGYGHPYWSEEYDTYLNELKLPQAEVTVEWAFGNPFQIGQTIQLKDFPKPYNSPYYLMEACGRLNTPIETHESYFLAHLASRWLEKVAGGDKPFCLKVDTWGPHHPFWVGEPYIDSIEPTDIPRYPSFGNSLEHRPRNHQDLLAYRRREGSPQTWEEWQSILARGYEHQTQVDAALGQVVAALDRLGLREETIIIYTADHGGAMASNGELVDKGWMMVEETVRIPLVIHWPGHTPSQTETDKLVSNMDLVPFVLEAAGAEVPHPIDGRSLLDLVQNPTSVPWPDDLMLEHHGHYDKTHFQRQLRWKNYKYTAHLDDRHELYDLDIDPYELNNLIDESGMTSILADMRARVKRWMVETMDESPESRRLISQMET